MSIYISIFLPICMALYLFVCVCLFVYLLSCPVVLFLTFFSQRHVGLTLSTFSRYSGHLFVQVEKSPRHATAIYEFQWPQRSIAGKV